MTKQQAYQNLQNGECNIEAWDYGIENNNAKSFAENNLHLIKIQDLKFNEGGQFWVVDSHAIDAAFTKDWTNYSGAGSVCIEIHESRI